MLLFLLYNVEDNKIPQHFFIHEMKTKGYDFIDVSVLHKPQINKIPPHFIYEVRTKGYDVINVNVLQVPQINEIPQEPTAKR